MSMRTNKVAKAQVDWHPADVIAALHKRNTSLRKIAQANGYSHINRVLRSPWYAAEAVVANALDLAPREIWPSRYQDMRSREHARRLTRKIVIDQPPHGPVVMQEASA